MTLVKERPPAITWRDRLEPIMESPNEWIRVYEYDLPATAYSVVSALRRGDKEAPTGNWQFRASKVRRRGVVYARYLGPKDEPQLQAAV